MASLKDRVVVITGGSSGIGRATALAFARQGANVVIAARREGKLEEVRQEVEALGGRCLAVRTDVTRPVDIEFLLNATIETFGQVDVWVNNAGYGLSASVEMTSPDDMERIWQTNYMGVFHGTQAALRQMRRQGRGHIINVSSMAARFPLPLGGAYSATKYAVNGLTEALALELNGTGIHASVVMPSVTETEFVDAMEKKVTESEPPSDQGWMWMVDSSEKVANRIVACAKRPRPTVYFMILGRLGLAGTDLFPAIWRFLAKKYIAIRTNGRGIPVPDP